MELAAPACQDGSVSAEDNPSPETIATLRIDLLDSDPPIWREGGCRPRSLSNSSMAIVQAAMGWEDAHLWEFTVGREPIDGSRAARLALQDLLRPRVTRLLYTYDMGDCWEHQLTPDQAAPSRSRLGPSALHRWRKPSTA